MQELGKLLVILGVVIAIAGFALWSGVGAGWLGRLPGDIRIERGYSGFYFPIVTCIGRVGLSKRSRQAALGWWCSCMT